MPGPLECRAPGLVGSLTSVAERRRARRRLSRATKAWIAVVAVAVAVAVVAGGVAVYLALRPSIATHMVAKGSGSEPLIVYVGNSFIGGSAQDSGETSRFPYLVSTALHARGETITAGGSGYVTPGDHVETFGSLADDIPSDAAVVVFLGSDDDQHAHSQQQIQDAAKAAWTTARRRAPHATLLIVSTPWVSTNPPAGILTSRDAVRAEATAMKLHYVDPIADRWWVGDVDGTIGADGLHPTDQGQREMADHLEPVVRTLLPRSGD
jgi:lysophospholipase L1-like esterase